MVISIIALLISILLPALATARDAAKTISCASTLRQVGMSMNLYADDYNGTMPLYWHSQWINPRNGATGVPWYDLIIHGSYMIPRPATSGAYYRNWSKAAYCPAREENVSYSYGLNVFTFPNNSTQGYDKGRPRDSIPQPSDRIMIPDSNPTGTSGAGYRVFPVNYLDKLLDVDGWADVHNGAFNATFVDSHVETLPTASLPEGQDSSSTQPSDFKRLWGDFSEL